MNTRFSERPSPNPFRRRRDRPAARRGRRMNTRALTPRDGVEAPDRRTMRERLATLRSAGILLPFVILFVVISTTSSGFLTKVNLLNILDQQSAILVMAAAGTF